MTRMVRAAIAVPILLLLGAPAPARAVPPEVPNEADSSLVAPDSPPTRLDIRRLERDLEVARDPDSVRFLLAVAWREAGGIEGRQRSLGLFQQIRRRYFHEPRYHAELARLYLEAGRRSDACDALDRAIRLRPQEPDAYLVGIRLLRHQILRYGRPEDVEEALARSARAAAVHPDHAGIREERAVCLQLACLFLDGARAARALAALQAADSLLALAPSSETGSVLRATALLDLGRGREAEALFGRWEAQVAAVTGRAVPGPPAPRRADAAGMYAGGTDAGGTDASGTDARGTDAGDTDSGGMHGGSTDAADRDAADGEATNAELAWARLDPTPLTPANEARLEHRRRLALADLLYRDVGRGRRGWETPRGDLFLRYGPPHAVEFRHAHWMGGAASIATDVPLRKWVAHQPESIGFPFLHPVQRWKYRYGDRDLAFDFVDVGFSGEFVPQDGVTFEAQLREIPSILPGTQEGRAPTFFFAAAGTRDEGGRTREALALAIPVAADEPAFRERGRRFLRVLDAGGCEVVVERTKTAPDSIREPAPGVRLFTLRSEAPLLPGEYTGEVLVESRHATATVAFPFAVRAFGREQLEISDLEFSFVPDTEAEEDRGDPVPNPGGLVVPGARTRVRYEVYNLTPGPHGIVRYRTRYALVPQAYARAVARLVEEGDPSVDPALRLGELGRSFGGVTLHPGNYADVSFPEVATPLEAGARGRFTFDPDAARLDPGAYALVVLVSDETAGRSVLAQAPVRVLAPEEVRAFAPAR